MLALLSFAFAAPADGVVCDGGVPVVTAIEADRRRIRVHLATVEHDLRAAPVDHLDADQRARRATALDTLHAYRAAGEFPHNVEVPGARVPVFRDADGRDCAVGHLVRASGDGALADAVDADWHLARVHEMDAPALADWGARNGFTVDELARIQPNYCMCEDDAGYSPVCGEDGVTYWNACVAQMCADTEPVAEGACAYEREACPDFQAAPAPAVTSCDDMWELCNVESPVYEDPTWTDWLAAQDQACLESAGETFDGPDDPPPREAEPIEAREAGCASAAAPLAMGALAGALALVVRSRRRSR